jgi:hypothetical protein
MAVKVRPVAVGVAIVRLVSSVIPSTRILSPEFQERAAVVSVVATVSVHVEL